MSGHIFIEKIHFFNDFTQSWFVYIDYFSSRPSILSGSGKFHPKFSSLLMISALELKFDKTLKKNKTYAWPIRVWLMILEPHK